MVNVGKNGQKLDVTSRIKGPDGKVVNHQYKKNEAKYIGHEIVIPGDYEICLNNRCIMRASHVWHVSSALTSRVPPSDSLCSRPRRYSGKWKWRVHPMR